VSVLDAATRSLWRNEPSWIEQPSCWVSSGDQRRRRTVTAILNWCGLVTQRATIRSFRVWIPSTRKSRHRSTMTMTVMVVVQSASTKLGHRLRRSRRHARHQITRPSTGMAY